MPSLTKDVARSTSASLFIKVSKKRQSDNSTMWSVVFVIPYRTRAYKSGLS